jgi:hypothetical protein
MKWFAGFLFATPGKTMAACQRRVTFFRARSGGCGGRLKTVPGIDSVQYVKKIFSIFFLEG